MKSATNSIRRNTAGMLIGLVAAAAIQTASAQDAKPDGSSIYSKNCAVCHTAMPPKVGDKAAWKPLEAKGKPALLASVIKGKGAMPPRAGKANLTDAEIAAAIDYMLDRSK